MQLDNGYPTRRALLTGVTGFIGGRVAARLLDRGWSVHALVRPSSHGNGVVSRCAERYLYDGTSGSVRTAISRAQPDVVIHLATSFSLATDPENTERLILTNVLFPTQLVDAMLAEGCAKLINTGSFWQHAGPDHTRSFDIYAATKTALEPLLRYYHQSQGLSCVTLKLYDTYGSGDPRRKIVSLLLDAARTGDVLEMSPGDQVLDLSHVDDIAAAFEAAANELSGMEEPFWETAFVSGERLSLQQLVGSIEDLIGRRVPVRFGARPYRPGEIMEPIAPAPAKILRGWQPSHSLQSGLRTLLETTPTTNQASVP